MIHAVAGVGEVGKAVVEILRSKFTVYPLDINDILPDKHDNIDVLHICFPFFQDSFVNSVMDWVHKTKPRSVVIHSTVPVGMTRFISQAYPEESPFFIHSPIRGRHPNLTKEIRDNYVKFFSFDSIGLFYQVQEISKEFEQCGVQIKIIPQGTKVTELGKLLELARFGVTLSLAKEQEKICKSYGTEYQAVVSDFVTTMNQGITPELHYPEVYPFEEFIGGHCVIENMGVLLKQLESDKIPAPLIGNAYVVGRGTIIWDNCNIYPSARIGKGVSVGRNSEIGNNVTIGDKTRIGFGSFIPEGVSIGKNVFIGPGVYFANDKKPPSHKKDWGKTLIGDNAMIGMRSTILPGITIGEGAVIGAGSIVTKDVKPGEVIYGQASYPHGVREDLYETKEAVKTRPMPYE